MPKSLDKTKGTLKRIRTPKTTNSNPESDGSEIVSAPKKKRVAAVIDGIEMSKQLAEQVKNKRTSRGGTRRSTKNGEPKLCGNGKPMPSLAELEAMYRDSDDEETTPNPAEPKRCATPEQKPEIDNVDLNSPTTLKHLASKAIDILSKTIDITDNDPPPPVIPPKKRKKPDQTYIVGCKERTQKPWKPRSKWCVGTNDYGVEPRSEDDEDDDCCPKKRKRRGKKTNLSKSVFNAKSDEIAERLKETECFETVCGGSPDSNDTVEYDFPNTSPSKSTVRAFSPLPSTSRDSETFMKNVQLFNDSLKCESWSNDSQNDVEVIEVPCETIIIDDSVNLTNSKVERTWDDFEDDCCIILDPPFKKERNSDTVPTDDSPKDDVYSSIDLTQTYDNEVFEIDDDDIESVIAENQAILGKDQKKNIDSVTSVDSSIIFVSETRNTEPTAQQVNSNVESSANTESQTNVTPEVRQTLEPAENVRSNEIEEVVTGFFNQQENNASTSSTNESTVDLTSCQESVRNRLSSLLDFFLRGYSSLRNNPNTSQDVVLVEESLPSVNTQSATPNILNVPVSIPVMPAIVSPKRKKKNQRVNEPVPNVPTQNQTSPSKGVKSKPSGISLGDCPICMESLENNPVASTLCGHVFCMECIKASIRANGKKCPTCRKALKGVGYHQLFI